MLLMYAKPLQALRLTAAGLREADTMVDAFRSMLDELMGKERDVPLAQRSGRKVNFSDPDVCKYQLVSICPNRLFKNTKSDLGKSGFCFHVAASFSAYCFSCRCFQYCCYIAAISLRLVWVYCRSIKWYRRFSCGFCMQAHVGLNYMMIILTGSRSKVTGTN